MPAPGDQHRETPASVNPFLDQGHRITEYTAQEIATLQSRLDRQLGPEYISTRPGNGGGKVHYLAAEKVINLANEVFGFNGWSSSIQNVQIDFVDENPQSGRINLGLSTIVRVTLRDGTFHEDIGYGHCENTKGKAAAFEKAKKEAATDAMKRALRNFGNVLGNCLYDKDYLQKIAKVKVAPSKWDAENLHRHPDYAPIKREPIADESSRQSATSAIQRNTSVQSAASFGSAEFEDDFGGNFLDETDFSHPDEVRLDDTINNGLASPGPKAPNEHVQSDPRQAVPRTNSVPQMRPPNVQAAAHVQGMQAPQRPQAVPRAPPNVAQPPARMLPPQAHNNPQRHPQGQDNFQNAATPQNSDGSRSHSSSGNTADSHMTRTGRQMNGAKGAAQQSRTDGLDEQGFPIPCQPPQGIPEGFVTGRKADLVNNPSEARPLNGDIAFNPYADSPSIRRTQGINPGKSAPVRRTELSGGNGNVQPLAQQPATGVELQNAGGNGMNGHVRQSGINFVNPSADMNRKIGMPGAMGGFANRSGYRLPSAVKRPAMADVTNTHGTDAVPDAKKTKVEGEACVQGQDAPATDANVITT